MTQDDGRGAGPQPSGAEACVRAGLFALVGTVLAALGHHAVAEGSVPWRLVTAFALAQFALVRPIARRRLSLGVVMACTLVAQGSLHLALTLAGSHHPETGHAGHSAGAHAAMAVGDGHAWHHASAAMTTAHMAAALVAAWLLQRADAAVAAALVTARAMRRAAAGVAARMVPRLNAVAVVAPPAVRPVGCFTLPTPALTRPLEHALVRRGPPGHAHVPVRPFTRIPASAGSGFTSKEFPCPRTTSAVRHAVSHSAVPPR